MSLADSEAVILVSMSCLVNTANEGGRGPLHWAAYNGRTDTAQLLHQNGELSLIKYVVTLMWWKGNGGQL